MPSDARFDAGGRFHGRSASIRMPELGWPSTPGRQEQGPGRINVYTSSCILKHVPSTEKPLEWIGSSHRDLMALPADIRRMFGFALSLAQAGDKHDAAKVLKGFGGAGVLEVVEDDAGGTYRAVYTVKFAEAVFVLHCFQKKSKRGIATPKEDMDVVQARLKLAELYVKELRK